MKKEHIGDGVYIQFDGYGYNLTTENGISVQNTIYLEPDVIRNMLHHINPELLKRLLPKEM